MHKLLCGLTLFGACLFIQPTAWLSTNAQSNQFTPPTPAQQKPPAQQKSNEEQDTTIRVATELIEVRAVVTDKNGQPIGGLTKDDFELLENNKPQEISFFSLTRVPSKDEIAKSASPSAALANAATAKPARSIALFADTMHMAPGNLVFLKQALRRFIDQQLSEQDLAALITSYGTLGLGEQFTRERRLLKYAAERLNVGPQERVSLFTPYLAGLIDREDRFALQEGIRLIQQEDRVVETDPRILAQLARARAREVLAIASFRSRATLMTLRAVVDRLAQMPGQRLLVLFSDGFTLLDNTGRQDNQELQNITSRAARSGVVIYSVDAKGLQGLPGMSAEFNAAPNMGYALGGEAELEDGLNALAADTGGKFFNNTNDIASAANQALTDNQLFYTLAYYPAEEGNLSKFRKLTLRVKGHPEYRIRTQKGYLPAALAKTKNEAAKTPDQRLAQVMLEPLAATELGVVAVADDFENTKDPAQATLRVYVDGQNLSYQAAPDGSQQFEVKIATLIFDNKGKPVFQHAQTINGKLRPERYELMRTRGFTYNQRLGLKPGFYQVRVGVTEPKTERIGTASAVVEIPNLKTKQLKLSSLQVADATLYDNPLPNEQAPPAKIIQGIHFFAPKQSMLYLFRLYQAPPSPTAKTETLELQTEIWQGETVISKGDWLPVESRTLDRDEKGLTVGGQLILNNFPVGIFELRIHVRVKGKKSGTHRMTVFGIE
jgi:VWFA-related protein